MADRMRDEIAKIFQVEHGMNRTAGSLSDKWESLQRESQNSLAENRSAYVKRSIGITDENVE